MAKIIIPSPLRKFTDNSSTVLTQANSVSAALNDLTNQHPKLRQHLLDDEGRIRSFIRLFVGEEDISALEQEKTSLGEHEILSIVPAIAGGLETPFN